MSKSIKVKTHDLDVPNDRYCPRCDGYAEHLKNPEGVFECKNKGRHHLKPEAMSR